MIAEISFELSSASTTISGSRGTAEGGVDSVTLGEEDTVGLLVIGMVGEEDTVGLLVIGMGVGVGR